MAEWRNMEQQQKRKETSNSHGRNSSPNRGTEGSWKSLRRHGVESTPAPYAGRRGLARTESKHLTPEKSHYRTCLVLAITRLMMTVFRIARLRGWVLVHSARMKKMELTPKQLSSVPCPTCGVAAGKRCVLLSGAPRSEPHVDRKFAATEAIERK